MATQPDARPETHADFLNQVVSAKLPGHHASFFASGEGTKLPTAVEEESGFVVDEWGQVFSFWTGWDAECGEEILEKWHQVQPREGWLDELGYVRARSEAGLPVPDQTQDPPVAHSSGRPSATGKSPCSDDAWYPWRDSNPQPSP